MRCETFVSEWRFIKIITCNVTELFYMEVKCVGLIFAMSHSSVPTLYIDTSENYLTQFSMGILIEKEQNTEIVR